MSLESKLPTPRPEPVSLGETPKPPAGPPRFRAIDVLFWVLVMLVCAAGTGAMLVLPQQSKTVGLVYGGF